MAMRCTTAAALVALGTTAALSLSLVREARVTPVPPAPAALLPAATQCLADLNGNCHLSVGQLLEEDVQPSVALEGLWVLDPRSLVYNGTATPLESSLGFVEMLPGNSGRYTLTNDIEFVWRPGRNGERDYSRRADLTKPFYDSGAFDGIATMEEPATYEVEVTGTTLTSMDSADALAENLIRSTFLHDGSAISVHPINRRRVVIAAGNSSVQLIPLPDMARHLLPNSMELDGEWTLTIVGKNEDDKVLLALSVTHVSANKVIFLLEGTNRHQFFGELSPSDNAGAEREIRFAPAMSSSFVVESDTLAAAENSMARLIELSNRLKISKSSTRGAPVLQLWNDSRPGLRASFARPKHAARRANFQEIPPAYWTWIPATAEGFELSSEQAAQPLTLEVRQTAENAAILELFAADDIHLRAILIQTAKPGDAPLRTVEQLSSGKDTAFTAALLQILDNTQSLDVDPSGHYLSIVGTDVSLAFESMSFPSTGTWVLDQRYSMIDNLSITPDSFEAHKLRLHVSPDVAGGVRAMFEGGVNRVAFSIVNKAPWPSRHDLRVTRVSKRTEELIDSGGEATPSSPGAMVARYFREGVRVKMARISPTDSAMVFTDSAGNTVVFFHSLHLTATLTGHWTRDSPAGETTLRLRPAGVGELRGEMTDPDGERHRIRLRETHDDKLDNDSSEARLRPVANAAGHDGPPVPSHWIGETRKFVTPLSSPLLRAALFGGSVEGMSSEPEADDTSSSTDVYRGEVTLHLQTEHILVAETPNGRKDVWYRSLPTETRLRVEGDWFVEFVAVQDPMDDESPTTVATAPRESNSRLLMTLHLRKRAPIANNKSLETLEYWSRRALTDYSGTVLELPSRRVLQRFTLQVNPFGVARIVHMEEIMEAGAGAASKEEKRLEEQLAIFLSLATEVDEDSPFTVEVSAADMTLTNGGSALIMSRGVPTHEVSPEAFLMFEAVFAASGSQYDTHPVASPYYAQQMLSHEPARRRRLSEDSHAVTADPLALRLIKLYRRRLQAADQLVTYLETSS